MKDETIIIACSTLKQELEMTMKKLHSQLPVVWVESGLHAWPEKLHTHIQNKIDELDHKYTTVLILFGFCGNSMINIKSGARTLVLPMVADCIPIFLGSQKMRHEMGSNTYFLTEGYLSFEHTMVSEHNRYIKRYGEKRANAITKKMMAHYKQISIIDTGAFEVAPIINEIREFSNNLEIPITVVPGNLIIIENLLLGKWSQEDFLIVKPRSGITFYDSLLANKLEE